MPDRIGVERWRPSGALRRSSQLAHRGRRCRRWCLVVFAQLVDEDATALRIFSVDVMRRDKAVSKLSSRPRPRVAIVTMPPDKARVAAMQFEQMNP
jgi:hypothetical protein